MRNDIFLRTKIKNGINLSVAFHKYHSNGDNGLNRYDPGEYFRNNLYPDTIISDYNNNGEYVENTPNPLAGKYIPNGFNTSNNSYALRAIISRKNTELGFSIFDFSRGNSSAITPYEYNLTDKSCASNYKSYYTYLKNNSKINSSLSLSSELVLRATNILPVSGFKYLYRYPGLVKNYKSYSNQVYLEEKLLYKPNSKSSFYLGLKGVYNQKSDRIISLGNHGSSSTSTSSSWIEANEGMGLNRIKEYSQFIEKEFASYALWDNKWSKYFNTSIGIRYDYNSYFGNILNPRLAIMYAPKQEIGIKFLYGTAFRQAGIFELYNEFRGNPNLISERIRTRELEVNNLLFGNRISLKTNIFHSIINNNIGKVPDSTMLAGERYENLTRLDITGISLFFLSQLHKNIRFYSNYSYIVGLDANKFVFYEINNVAKFKFNAGINFKFLKNRFISDFRINYVGKRKAPISNTWIQTYENGYAPHYLKANLSISYKFCKEFTIQLIANNLFDEQYYGLGRETGSSFIDSYDAQNNINPVGHIPAYHPQEGRTFLANFIYKF